MLCATIREIKNLDSLLDASTFKIVTYVDSSACESCAIAAALQISIASKYLLYLLDGREGEKPEPLLPASYKKKEIVKKECYGKAIGRQRILARQIPLQKWVDVY